MKKEEIRKVYLTKKVENKSEKGKKICNLLIPLLDKIYNKKYAIHCFLPLPSEPNIWPIINKYKNIVIPKCEKNGELSHFVYSNTKVEKGKYSILEPNQFATPFTDLSKIQIVIIPLVTFDRYGNRIGKGAGYYDRFLAKVPHALKIGVSFYSPHEGKIPFETHDIKLDMCVTPHFVYRFLGST